MNILDIKKFDFINGKGIRVSIFVSGCTHHCQDCFNKKTWNPNFGFKYDEEIKEQLFDHLKANKEIIDGLSLLGGDPTYFKNVPDLIKLTKEFKELYPDKTIWIWSGYTFEEAIKNKERKKLLLNCDVLIDGKFEPSQKDLSLYYRGSKNQRVIDLKNTFKENKIILYKD